MAINCAAILENLVEMNHHEKALTERSLKGSAPNNAMKG